MTHGVKYGIHVNPVNDRYINVVRKSGKPGKCVVKVIFHRGAGQADLPGIQHDSAGVVMAHK